MADVFAQADRIKARLNICATPQQVHEVADAERAEVQAMAKGSADGKTMAIQIANLKAYILGLMRNGEKIEL